MQRTGRARAALLPRRRCHRTRRRARGRRRTAADGCGAKGCKDKEGDGQASWEGLGTGRVRRSKLQKLTTFGAVVTGKCHFW